MRLPSRTLSVSRRIIYACESFSIFLPLASILVIDDFTRAVFCPKDIIVESLTLKGITMALAGALLAPLLLMVIITRLNPQFVLVKKRPSGPFSLYAQPIAATTDKLPIMAHTAFALFILSALIVGYGGSCFYYVDPENIVINNGFFGNAETYTWSDINAIQEHCTLKSHTLDTPSFWLDITLSDGRSFSVTADDELAKIAPLILAQKKAAGAADPISYSYSTDNSQSGICPKNFDLSFPAS